MRRAAELHIAGDDFHEAATQDLVEVSDEPRDTDDLPWNPIMHNETIHTAIVSALERGAEFYSPNGQRLKSVEEIADVFAEFGKILGPKLTKKLVPVADDDTVRQPLELPSGDS